MFVSKITTSRTAMTMIIASDNYGERDGASGDDDKGENSYDKNDSDNDDDNDRDGHNTQ